MHEWSEDSIAAAKEWWAKVDELGMSITGNVTWDFLDDEHMTNTTDEHRKRYRWFLTCVWYDTVTELGEEHWAEAMIPGYDAYIHAAHIFAYNGPVG